MFDFSVRHIDYEGASASLLIQIVDIGSSSYIPTLPQHKTEELHYKSWV